MARKNSPLVRGLMLCGTILGITFAWFIINEVARAGGENHPDMNCHLDYQQNMCFSPGQCPQKVYYCDSSRTFGNCEVPGTGCFEVDISDFDNCGQKYDCSTGMPTMPPKNCWTPVCEDIPGP